MSSGGLLNLGLGILFVGDVKSLTDQPRDSHGNIAPFRSEFLKQDRRLMIDLSAQSEIHLNNASKQLILAGNKEEICACSSTTLNHMEVLFTDSFR